MWELLEESDPKIWGKGGSISWNCVTHQIMGNPEAVEILYNETENRLGFRGVYRRGALTVLYTDDCTYTIEATDRLDENNVTLPSEDWTASVQGPLPINNNVPGTKHMYHIVWIDIPE